MQLLLSLSIHLRMFPSHRVWLLKPEFSTKCITAEVSDESVKIVTVTMLKTDLITMK